MSKRRSDDAARKECSGSVGGGRLPEISINLVESYLHAFSHSSYLHVDRQVAVADDIMTFLAST